jgi:hypothetical protein
MESRTKRFAGKGKLQKQYLAQEAFALYKKVNEPPDERLLDHLMKN